MRSALVYSHFRQPKSLLWVSKLRSGQPHPGQSASIASLYRSPVSGLIGASRDLRTSVSINVLTSLCLRNRDNLHGRGLLIGNGLCNNAAVRNVKSLTHH